jgi:acetyl esterase/lipase
MKVSFVMMSIAAASLLGFGSAQAATPAKILSRSEIPAPKSKIKTPDKVLLLYPKGQDVDEGIVENGVKVTEGPLENNGITSPEYYTGALRLYNVGDSARIEIFHPKKPNGQAVVICPGGGYFFLSCYNEGLYAVDWFVRQGFTAVLLKYRLPNGHWRVPLQDVQNALRYCRAHAAEWKVNQIGVVGCSAGGHLAASASTLFVDDATRPDFAVLLYPVIRVDLGHTHKGSHDCLIGKEDKWLNPEKSYSSYVADKAVYDSLVTRYCLQNDVTAKTPQTFIALSSNDKTVPVESSLGYYKALVDNKVHVEMHIFPTGGHGWGFTTSDLGHDGIEPYRDEFFTSLKRFLEDVKK